MTVAVKEISPTLRVGATRYSWVSDDTIGVPWDAPFHIALTPPQRSERVVTFCRLASPVKEIRDAITFDQACAICLREYSPHRPKK
jgi:hypothetical protein